MIEFKEHIYTDLPQNADFILGADIGGTNSNFGIFAVRDNQLSPLLISVHAKSGKISDFTVVVVQLLDYLKTKHGITGIQKACFGAAGVASQEHDRAKPTNLPFVIDAHAIKLATGLQEVVIINDFEAVAYGIKMVKKKDLITVHKGVPRTKENKAIIGAGTGLGKCIMGWDELDEQYVPIPSEGGHADFPAYTNQELDLMHFIQKKLNFDCPVSWENILSGKGIMNIYAFLSTINSYKSNHINTTIENSPHPDYIFGQHAKTPQCGDTFRMFAGFYGRCAKDFALETLALGGMYIAGGIASKNLDLFSLPEFRHEFLACGKQGYLLKDVPITVIVDYNVSLYGAARYLLG